jgi:hypothetical protein
MSDVLLLVYENDVEELIKGKGNRDGLVQQIITYVKDGKTVTRKQWVRSEFADHAKKNEEEKKKTLLKEEEREERKRKNDLRDQEEKARNQDKRIHKKKVKEKQELEEKLGAHSRPHTVSKDGISEYKKKMEKLRKQEEEERKKQDSKNKNHSKKEKKHGAFGQAESTRKQNKDDENVITKPNQ